jgi:hypothetical protein
VGLGAGALEQSVVELEVVVVVRLVERWEARRALVLAGGPRKVGWLVVA